MSDCSQHKKDVAGITDMKLLAEMIGDLHYETLAELFKNLEIKIYTDSRVDNSNGKVMLSQQLQKAASGLMLSHVSFEKAWEISKPFMNPPKQQLNG